MTDLPLSSPEKCPLELELIDAPLPTNDELSKGQVPAIINHVSRKDGDEIRERWVPWAVDQVRLLSAVPDDQEVDSATNRGDHLTLPGLLGYVAGSLRVGRQCFLFDGSRLRRRPPQSSFFAQKLALYTLGRPSDLEHM